MNIKRVAIVLAHAFVVWALCTAVTSAENALIVHAIGAPIFAAAVSFVYFTKFNYTTPLRTAAMSVANL